MPYFLYDIRNRTPSEYICYALYFCFSNLSLRKAAMIDNHFALSNEPCFYLKLDIKIQSSKGIIKEKENSRIFLIQKDETVIRIGSELIWLWVAIEIESKEIIGTSISQERNMFVAEHFISEIL
ncbi:MAG: hypothetical protein ABJB76_09140 [Candidatus Nitrosocosmicus sp.]